MIDVSSTTPGGLWPPARATATAGAALLTESLLPQLVITLRQKGALDPKSLFPTPPASVRLEIGFGAGEHLAAQAEQDRTIGFIGCEVFENGSPPARRDRAPRPRQHPHLCRRRTAVARLPGARLDRAGIHSVSRSWPKQRHHKRRLVAPATLDRLANVMQPGAELRLATDDRGYLVWMLEHVTAHPISPGRREALPIGASERPIGRRRAMRKKPAPPGGCRCFCGSSGERVSIDPGGSALPGTPV